MINQKIALGGAIAVVILAIAIPVVYYNYQNIAPNQTIQNLIGTDLAMTTEIKAVGNGAFGSLSAQIVNTGISANSEIARTNNTIGLGGGYGGGGGVATSVSTPASADAAKSSMPFWPGAYSFKFVYKGEPITLDQTQMAVYKRIKNNTAGTKLANLVKGLNLGPINLSGLSSPQVQNISLIEDRDFGYVAYFDLSENTMSINENWQKWQTPEIIRCQSQPNGCPYVPITESDILSDEELIKMTNDFLKKFSVDLKNYNQPEVDKSWQPYYLMAQRNGEQTYIPDMVSIIYPLKIKDQQIIDQGGNKYGMRVSVNLRYQKVNSLWGLTSQNYESSNYDAETSIDRILKIAAKGGINQVGNVDAPDLPEIELGTPEIGLTIYYQYQDGVNSELYVPALIFPVTKIPENTYYYGSRVVVPLAKELLDQYDNNDNPRPMPLIETGAVKAL